MALNQLFQQKYSISTDAPDLFCKQHLHFDSFLDQNQCEFLNFKRQAKQTTTQKQEMNTPNNLLEKSQQIPNQKMMLDYFDFDNENSFTLGDSLMDEGKYDFPHFTLDCQMMKDDNQQMRIGTLVSVQNEDQKLQNIELASFFVQSQSFQNRQVSCQTENGIKIGQIDESDQTKYLLKVVDIKNQKGKNTNLPKYAIRLLQDYLPKYLEMDQFEGPVREKIQSLLRKILRIKYTNSPKNLALVSSFLKHNQSGNGDNEPEKQAKKILRQAMRKILRQKSMKEVVKNNRVTTKKTLLIGSKVYALRCMMSGLTQRLQSA